MLCIITQTKHVTLLSSRANNVEWTNLLYMATKTNYWETHSRSHKPSCYCRNGPTCGLFLGDTLKGQPVIHRSLWMYSLGRITSCHLYVGGQFVSAGLQSWDLQPWNLVALSTNCLWVAFKFIDSLGDIVLLLYSLPFVDNINCDSRFSALVHCGWTRAKEQCDTQRECPLRGQDRRPLQVPQSFS